MKEDEEVLAAEPLFTMRASGSFLSETVLTRCDLRQYKARKHEGIKRLMLYESYIILYVE